MFQLIIKIAGFHYCKKGFNTSLDCLFDRLTRHHNITHCESEAKKIKGDLQRQGEKVSRNSKQINLYLSILYYPVTMRQFPW